MTVKFLCVMQNGQMLVRIPPKQYALQNYLLGT